MSDIDRKRTEQLCREAGLDALVFFQPEAFRYAVGAPAGVATMWGRAGSAIALVPANASASIAAIASDHAAGAIRKQPEIDLRTHRIWIDSADLAGAENITQINEAYHRSGPVAERPETFDRTRCFELLSELLAERGLDRSRIGADLEFMPAADFFALKQALPDVDWVDGSLLLRRLRMIKSGAEIIRLRRAALAAEAGLVKLAETVRPGVSLAALSAAWKDGALASATDNGFALSGHWDYISVGPDLADMSAIVTPGALIKADVGTLVDGYSSDGARTVVYGQPSPIAAEIFKALENAFAAGLEQLRPGNSFASVHTAMLGSMRRDGFSEYYRGHFGHSVGGGVGIEEWPFFSATSTEIIAPDMVVALEAPFYGQGLGALMIEDQFLITETGAECMTTLSRSLRDLATD
jgi:Xaa-Pro aminopeptidase